MPTLIILLVSTLLKIQLALTSPAAHRLTISVRVSPECRAVEIAAQNDDFERSSTFQTATGRSQYFVEWRGLPEGLYEVRGRAVGADLSTADSEVRRIYVR